MKKLCTLIFFVAVTVGYSQKKTNGLDKSNSSLVEVLVSMGISSATSTFSDNSYAADGSYFELSATYYFSKIGLGASLGSFSNPTEGNLLDFGNQEDYPIEFNSEKWKTSYYGIGPNYRTNIGELEAIIYGRAGIMSVKPITLEGNFNVENADAATTIPVYNFSTKETSKTGFYTAGIRLGYKLNPNLGLYISANYLSSFSDEIIAQDGTKQFADINKDGVINEIDIVRQEGEQVDFQYTDKNIQPQVFNYGFGLSYSFGKRTNKNGGTEKPSAGGQQNPYFQDNELNGDMMLTNSGSIVFTNPAKEKAEQKNKQQKIIGILPTNNSVFKNANEIKNFTWKVIGTKIANPQFIIEVTKINSKKHTTR